MAASFDNGTAFDAIVRAFIPEEHASTRTRAIRLTFDQSNLNEALAINQNVTIHIPISNSNSSLSVHKDAVITSGQGHIVFVVGRGNCYSKTDSYWGMRWEIDLKCSAGLNLERLS